MVDWSSLTSILENTLALFRPYFSWRSLPKLNRPYQDDTTTDCNHHDNCTSLEEKLSGLGIEIPATDHLSSTRYCHRYCIFNRLSARTHHERYSDMILTMTSKTSQPLCENVEPCSSLCLIHSPFAVLMSGQISVTDFCSLLESLSSSPTHDNFARDMLHCFFFMAECSCLLWTRYVYYCISSCTSHSLYSMLCGKLLTPPPHHQTVPLHPNLHQI